MTDYWRYLQPTTDVVAYAWNAEMVCVPCTRERLTAILADEGYRSDLLITYSLDDLRTAYAWTGFGATRDGINDLDSTEFPHPVTAGEDGIDEDSCGTCLEKIKDTY